MFCLFKKSLSLALGLNLLSEFLEFSVDREARRKVVAGRQDTAQPASHEKPLSPEQQAYVQQLLEGAPEALRSSISKAIIASIQATDQF